MHDFVSGSLMMILDDKLLVLLELSFTNASLHVIIYAVNIYSTSQMCPIGFLINLKNLLI